MKQENFGKQSNIQKDKQGLDKTNQQQKPGIGQRSDQTHQRPGYESNKQQLPKDKDRR